MSTIGEAIQRREQLINSALGGISGRKNLSLNFPEEFEYYLCSFELIDSQDRTVELLTFPVMPRSIDIRDSNLTSIKKTAGGVVSLTTPNFIPLDISLNGTFGRKFRFIVGNENIDLAAFSSEAIRVVKNIPKNIRGTSNESGEVFSKNIKTGYGVTKILQKILKKSTAVDENGYPYKLLFYNSSFGESYLVEPLTYDFRMNEQENMMWSYNISMKAIAPIEAIISDKTKLKAKISDLMSKDLVQKRVTKALEIVKSQGSLVRNKLLANTVTLNAENRAQQLLSVMLNKTGITKIQKSLNDFNDARPFGY